MRNAFNSHALTAVFLVCLLAAAGCNSDSPESLIASGKEYQAKKDHSAAVIQFKSALQADPNSADARVLLGKALMDSGDPSGAVIELSKAFDQNAAPEAVLPSLARAMLLTGNLEKLTTLYGNAELADKSASASLKTSLSMAWDALGNRAKAQAALTAALAAEPEFGPALILRARQVAAAGEHDAALALVDGVVAREPMLPEGWQAKGDILLYAKNDIKGAEAAFRSALAADKAHIPAHQALILIRLRERDLAGIEAQAEQMRAVLPKHPQMLFVDAQIAYHKRDLAKARELIQPLLRGAPQNVQILQLAGAIEAHGGSMVVAERQYAKALAINPDLSLARVNLARVHIRNNQPAKALETILPLLGQPGAPAIAFALAGQANLSLGNIRAAEEQFRRAAVASPDDSRMRTALAVTRLSQGDANSAFAELETLASTETDVYADMAIVSARLRRNEVDEALKAVEAMSKKQPENAAVANLRGRVHLARKDMPAARRAFEQAQGLDPNDFQATSNLTAMDILEKRPEDARRRLEASIASDAGNVVARMALVELRTRAGADLAELRQLLADGIKASPGSVEPRLQLIHLLARKRQYKDALVAAQEAAAALPDNTYLLDAVGIAQMQAGDTQQALTTFRRIAGIDTKSAVPYVRLADIYKSIGETVAAETSLKRALELEPGLQAAQLALLDLLLQKGRTKDALDIAGRLQRDQPTLAAGYLLEGALHRRAKAPEAAIAAYRTGLAKTGPNSDLGVQLHTTLIGEGRFAEADRFAAAWEKDRPEDVAFDYHLATIAISRGDLTQAQTRLERVLVSRPNNPLALNNLAWVLVAQNKPGAVAYAQRAVDRMPGQAALVDTLAMAMAADKQVDQALVLQKQAVELSPDNLGLRLNLARIALQAGDKDLARKELERLQTVGKDFPLQAEVTKLLKTL